MASNARGARCGTCGVLATASAGACSFCHADLSARPTAPASPTRSVPEAVDAWAKGVFGAPRRLSPLITHVNVYDEVIHRLYTEVTRREMREVRAPSVGRAVTSPRVEQLRAQSSHVAVCSACDGKGIMTCPDCQGTCRAPCAMCSGTGEITRHYKTAPSRQIKCTACRGRMTVHCERCSKKGECACADCEGSGHQVVAWTFEEQTAAHLWIGPQGPALASHPWLAERRPVGPTELTTLTVAAAAERHGLLDGGVEGVSPDVLGTGSPAMDPARERVRYQQYLQLSLIRREAVYEMGGAEGRLRLAGPTLAAFPDAAAIAPFQSRLRIWGGVAVAVAAASGTLVSFFHGTGAYFQSSNTTLAWLGLVTTGLCVAAAGGVLRAVGTHGRRSRLGSVERGMGLAGLAGFALLMALGFASRPRLGQVSGALAAGNLSQASDVADALEELHGATPEVREAKDSVLLARAAAATGDQRLEGLDAVASGGGAHAREAAAAAREERIHQIEQLTETPGAAIGRIDQWFPEWKSDPQLSALRASSADRQASLCKEDLCRLAALRGAQASAPTPERAAQLEELTKRLLAALTWTEVPAETTLARLQRLRAQADLAASVSAVAGGDGSLLDRAKTATQQAAAGRAKVPLLGSGEAVLAELVGPLVSRDARTTRLDLPDVEAFASLDPQHLCRGLYAVGKAASRALPSPDGPGDRLLTQAVGAPATVHRPTTSTGTARWVEGTTPVVARWKDGTLVELRIGDAAP